MSPQVLRTTRRLQRETVQLERFTGLDGQGAPSYASAVDFQANVVEYDMATSRGQQYVITADGSRVETPLTLYVPGDSSVVPGRQDRITLADDRIFIVMERSDPRGLRRSRSSVDHYRFRCRVE